MTLNVEREKAAARYVLSANEPDLTPAERVHAAFVSGAEWAAQTAEEPEWTPDTATLRWMAEEWVTRSIQRGEPDRLFLTAEAYARKLRSEAERLERLPIEQEGDTDEHQ